MYASGKSINIGTFLTEMYSHFMGKFHSHRRAALSVLAIYLTRVANTNPKYSIMDYNERSDDWTRINGTYTLALHLDSNNEWDGSFILSCIGRAKYSVTNTYPLEYCVLEGTSGSRVACRYNSSTGKRVSSMYRSVNIFYHKDYDVIMAYKNEGSVSTISTNITTNAMIDDSISITNVVACWNDNNVNQTDWEFYFSQDIYDTDCSTVIYQANLGMSFDYSNIIYNNLFPLNKDEPSMNFSNFIDEIDRRTTNKSEIFRLIYAGADGTTSHVRIKDVLDLPEAKKKAYTFGIGISKNGIDDFMMFGISYHTDYRSDILNGTNSKEYLATCSYYNFSSSSSAVDNGAQFLFVDDEETRNNYPARVRTQSRQTYYITTFACSADKETGTTDAGGVRWIFTNRIVKNSNTTEPLHLVGPSIYVSSSQSDGWSIVSTSSDRGAAQGFDFPTNLFTFDPSSSTATFNSYNYIVPWGSYGDYIVSKNLNLHNNFNIYCNTELYMNTGTSGFPYTTTKFKIFESKLILDKINKEYKPVTRNQKKTFSYLMNQIKAKYGQNIVNSILDYERGIPNQGGTIRTLISNESYKNESCANDIGSYNDIYLGIMLHKVNGELNGFSVSIVQIGNGDTSHIRRFFAEIDNHYPTLSYTHKKEDNTWYSSSSSYNYYSHTSEQYVVTDETEIHQSFSRLNTGKSVGVPVTPGYSSQSARRAVPIALSLYNSLPEWEIYYSRNIYCAAKATAASDSAALPDDGNLLMFERNLLLVDYVEGTNLTTLTFGSTHQTFIPSRYQHEVGQYVEITDYTQGTVTYYNETYDKSFVDTSDNSAAFEIPETVLAYPGVVRADVHSGNASSGIARTFWFLVRDRYADVTETTPTQSQDSDVIPIDTYNRIITMSLDGVSHSYNTVFTFDDDRALNSAEVYSDTNMTRVFKVPISNNKVIIPNNLLGFDGTFHVLFIANDGAIDVVLSELIFDYL